MIDEWEDPWFAPPRRGVDNNPVTPIDVIDSPSEPQDTPQPADDAQTLRIDAEPSRPEDAVQRVDAEKPNNHSVKHVEEKANKVVKRGVLWARPKLQFDWGQPDRHRKVDWSEIFADLIVVAVALQVSTALKAEPTWATLGVVFVKFMTFFDGWMNLTVYMSRYYGQDLHFKFWHIVYVCGALTMSIFIDTASALRSVRLGFVLGRIATIVPCCALLAVNAWHLPRVRISSIRFVVAYLVCLAVYVASIFPEPVWVTVLLWIVAYFVSFGGANWSWAPHKGRIVAVPLHIEHMCERYGAIVMIVLGEAILAQVLVPREDGVKFWAQVFCGLTISYLLHVLYFETQPFSASMHAMRRSRASGRVFGWSHGPLTFACIICGCGLKILLYYSHAHLHVEHVWLLGGFLALTVALILVLRLSHRGWRSELGLLREWDQGFLITASGHCKKAKPQDHEGAMSPTSLPLSPTGTQLLVDSQGKGKNSKTSKMHAMMSALLTPVDTTARRRLLWLCRGVSCLMVLGWTILVAVKHEQFSALGFVAGLTVLTALVHVWDYPDILSYSDLPSSQHHPNDAAHHGV